MSSTQTPTSRDDSHNDEDTLTRIRREQLDAHEPDETAREQPWWPGNLELRGGADNAQGPRYDHCPICGESTPNASNHIREYHAQQTPENTNFPGCWFGIRGD